MPIAGMKYRDVADGVQPGQLSGDAVLLNLASPHRATETVDRTSTEYTGNPGPCAVRDPSRNERRIVFGLPADSVATYGRP